MVTTVFNMRGNTKSSKKNTYLLFSKRPSTDLRNSLRNGNPSPRGWYRLRHRKSPSAPDRRNLSGRLKLFRTVEIVPDSQKIAPDSQERSRRNHCKFSLVYFHQLFLLKKKTVNALPITFSFLGLFPVGKFQLGVIFLHTHTSSTVTTLQKRNRTAKQDGRRRFKHRHNESLSFRRYQFSSSTNTLSPASKIHLARIISMTFLLPQSSPAPSRTINCRQRWRKTGATKARRTHKAAKTPRTLP